MLRNQGKAKGFVNVSVLNFLIDVLVLGKMTAFIVNVEFQDKVRFNMSTLHSERKSAKQHSCTIP